MKSKLLFKLEARLGAWLLRLLRLSIRFDVKAQPPNDYPCVYIFWHRNLLLMTLQRVDTNAVVLVSSSRDGELIAGPLNRLGYHTVRGSSTRGGSMALRQMLRLAQDHSLAITPDGPKGPAETVHPGLFELALLARIPIIPVAVDVNREWVFNSWDRFRFPLPFSRIKVRYKQQIWVRSKTDFAIAETALRQSLSSFETGLWHRDP